MPAASPPRGSLAGPDFEGFGSLMEEHADAIGGFAAGFGGGGEQRGFGGPINHVIHRAGFTEGKGGGIKGQGVAGLEAEGGGIEHEVYFGGRIPHIYLHGWETIANLGGDGFGFAGGAV